jgi:hypothetical protein
MYKRYFFTALFFFSLFSVQAQSSDNTEEITLGIPECHQMYNEWKKVQEALTTLNGVKVKGVCTRHDCILLQVDRSVVANNQVIFDKIKTVNPQFTIFEKIITFEQMMEMCREELIKQKHE